MTEQSHKITQLINDIQGGNAEAQSDLLEVAYGELRAMAAGFMRRERVNHTLQATALVNEAAIRLMDSDSLSNAKNRLYFFAAMAQAMRRILIDHARKSTAQRRGGATSPDSLDVVVHTVQQEQGIDLVALNDALDQLASANSRHAEIVVLRFFGGLSIEEVAEHLQLSVSMINKEWRLARAWLRQKLADV